MPACFGPKPALRRAPAAPGSVSAALERRPGPLRRRLHAVRNANLNRNSVAVLCQLQLRAGGRARHGATCHVMGTQTRT